MNLPILNMVGWTIDDYELAFAGIRQVSEASLWLQNQPRAYSEAKLQYLPGADFIVQIGEDWCGNIISDIVDSLRAIRFDDAEHDERRILLLIHYETSFGCASSPLAEIIQMALGQSVRPAA
ncbi:hypothetical protein [Devosia sp. 2618]|uniref:hypothetical protein n=1 Tax=Devosia sp. 2618 TaxID=3156454 RepID=UPI003398093E